MPPQYLRAYAERADAAPGEPGSPIRFTASTENVARDGLIIEAAGWDLANYERNPVVLWAHDLMGARPPIGRAVKVFVQKKQLIADVQFDQGDEFARMVEQKYRDGYLNAVSVGWDTKEFAPPKGANSVPRVTKSELLEISAVPVGSDPGALKNRQARALRDLAAEIEALASDPPADEPADQPQEPAQPEPKPQPSADDPAGAWEDAAAAMVRLFLPGERLTERERRRDYHRLAKVYRQTDREVPEFVPLDLLDLYDLETVRGLFLEGEPDLYPELFREPGSLAIRAGAVLNRRNREDLEQASNLIQAVLRRAAKEAEQAEDDNPFADEDEDDERGQLSELDALLQLAPA